MWWGVLAVAACGVVATAHGLFAVAVVSGVAPPVAALYVPITDGLALVAYASTSRLRGVDRGYAWLVVVTAAGLSGLAQAVNLAGLGEPDWRLRFGVGYWPAVAVAVAAHLLWLVGRVAPVHELAAEPAHLSEPSRQTEPPCPASEPPTEPPTEPVEDGATEPPSRPAEPAQLVVAARLPEPATEPATEPPAEPAHLGSVSPIRRPTPAARSAGRKAARSGLQECGCGLDYCSGLVPKSTRTAHHRRVREAAELAVRVQSNGHRERVSVP